MHAQERRGGPSRLRHGSGEARQSAEGATAAGLPGPRVRRIALTGGIAIPKTRAVIIGRSEIVGKPMALLLLQRHATVTICHSKTPDLAAVCREADILVAAVGRAGLVTKGFVKPGATVVDVGMNTITDEAVAKTWFPEGHPRLARFRERGSLLVGDVHPDVANVAGALTPVPGGVGPLTIAMLMMNTLRAARARGG